MAYMALYRKWRSQTFDEIVGQEAVVTALRNQIIHDRIGHAYLFCGTRGTGKTSMAKIFARAVNCLHPVNGNPCNECELCRESESGFNLIEIDAASNNGVDNIREIRDEVRYTPAKGRFRVYIIDEVHMLSAGAFNALLKTLEEPPEHVIFILATTEPHKVLPTIVSRCQRYDFKRFTAGQIFDHLKEVCEAEGIRATDDALRYIARAADGGMRDSLSILEQCVSFYVNEEIDLNKVQEILGTAGAEEYARLTDALAARRAPDALRLIGDIFMAGRDVSAFTTGLISHLRSLLLMKAMGRDGAAILELGEEEAAALSQQADHLPAEQLTWFIESLTDLESRMKYSSEKRVLLEVEIIRLCRGASETTDEALLARIAAVEKRLDEGVFVQKEQSKAADPKPNAQKAAPPPSLEDLPKIRQPKMIMTSGGAAGRAIEAWAAIKKKIISQERGLYTLNLMEIAPGADPDQIILSSDTEFYIKQLEDDHGRRLRLIERAIEDETGAKVRVLARKKSVDPTPDVDMDDIVGRIHMDVEFTD
ncbi:MAG: DNA polymerase III subunit gamma/tau [Clostridiales bacterium]|nr:DNA polymerase III subunit gamma/tau [Clostridiales bacterium]